MHTDKHTLVSLGLPTKPLARQVIQKGDEGADWSYESQKMALIYAQSYVTLGAASVKDANESFLLEPRFPFVEVPFRKTAQSPSDGKLLSGVSSCDFAEDFEVGTYSSDLAESYYRYLWASI